eukprot:TRINITY_DN4498_c0_g1_i7.p1 TRINITY_DN4498_c0_g1~~TRINITY_DN4498_c0_g1_i7.p1  ORF type:complete len:284 (-),score=68.47 TRINITY_DN4498_c0_g1_i7:92-943(-)
MILGVDVGGTKLACVFIDVENASVKTSSYNMHGGACFSWTAAETEIRKFLAQHPDLAVQLVGVGIAIPGLINHEQVLKTVDIPLLEGWIPKNMPEFSGLVVKLVHDGKAAGLESTRDAGTDSTIVTFVVGTGIGCSMLVHGKPLLGKNGWAGEIGAAPIGGEGPVDYRAGGKWLLRERMGGIDANKMKELVDTNDEVALRAIQESGRTFGSVIATTINIFNPEKIILGGGCLKWKGYVDAALEKAKEDTFGPLWNECTIEIYKDPHLLVVRGAARSVLSELIK